MNDDIGKIKDCVGCGFCCTQAVCSAGQRVYPGAKYCPALKWNGKRHICNLMNLPGILGETYRVELYANEGCCSNLNSWRREPLQDRTKKIEIQQETIPELFQIFLHCLGKEWISPDVLYLTISAFLRELEKKGYSDKKRENIGQLIVHYLKGNESSFKKGFMGSL
jgi:hypothetical protein